jgi:hypothetical protein
MSGRGTTFERKWRFLRSSSKQIQCVSHAPFVATVELGLECYGAAELQVAIREALDRGVPHPNAVRLALERRREQRGEAPPVTVELSADVQARDAPVQPHALGLYDQLKDALDE